MLKPAKGTILAPNEVCNSERAVDFKAWLSDMDIKFYKYTKKAPNRGFFMG
jgi:hypothetical protein